MATTTTTTSTTEEDTMDIDYVQLDIEGRIFNVTREEIKLFGSDFLSKLVDPTSPFGGGRQHGNVSTATIAPTTTAEDNVRYHYTIQDRNPTYFEAFFLFLTDKEPQPQIQSVDYFKYLIIGSRGSDNGNEMEKNWNDVEQDVLQEASFWGVKHRILGLLYGNVCALQIQRVYFRWKGLQAREVATEQRQRVMNDSARLTTTGKGFHKLPYQPCAACGVRWGACRLQLYDYQCSWPRICLPPTHRPHHLFVCEPCGRNKRPDLAMEKFVLRMKNYKAFGCCFLCHQGDDKLKAVCRTKVGFVERFAASRG